MHYALAILAFVASVSAQTATGTPPSCQTDYPSNFEIAPVNVSSSAASRKRALENRATACTTNPVISLKGGVLTDQNGRTGEVVANHQFQFDNPLQAGRLFDAGFSVCSNGTLALGGSAIFWACNSGSFSNLYDQSLGKQCYEIYIDTIACSGGSSVSAASSVVPATSAATVASSTPSTSTTPITTMTTPYQPQMPTVAPVPATTTSLAGPAIISTAPYPVGNTTTAAGTASSTAPTVATSTALTAPASGASALTIGSTFGAVAAAIVAFAML